MCNQRWPVLDILSQFDFCWSWSSTVVDQWTDNGQLCKAINYFLTSWNCGAVICSSKSWIARKNKCILHPGLASCCISLLGFFKVRLRRAYFVVGRRLYCPKLPSQTSVTGERRTELGSLKYCWNICRNNKLSKARELTNHMLSGCKFENLACWKFLHGIQLISGGSMIESKSSAASGA